MRSNGDESKSPVFELEQAILDHLALLSEIARDTTRNPCIFRGLHVSQV